jgi:hypothetical protein
LALPSFGLGWVLVLSADAPAIQAISTRTGRLTGHGVPGALQQDCPVLFVLAALLFVANTINPGGGPLRCRAGIPVVVNVARSDPIKALFWGAVISGDVAAPGMGIIMLRARRRS